MAPFVGRPSLGRLAFLYLGPCLLGRIASADGLFARTEPGYVRSSTDTTDDTDRTTRLGSSLFQMRNQLTLDRQLFPLLGFNAGGSYDFATGTTIADGVSTRVNPRTWMGHAQVNWGLPALNASLAYSRSQGFTDIQTALGRVSATSPVREVASARGAWRPADLPSIDVNVSRARIYDTRREVQDLTSDSGQLTASFKPDHRADVTHRVSYSHQIDHLHLSDSTDLTNAFAASWGDQFWDNRVSTFASYNLGTRSTNTISAGPGGVVSTQRNPIAGLSFTEAFPLTPTRIILSQNPALVDGDLGGSAGVDLGFGPSTSNDVVPRDVGGQFAPGTGAVNTVHVWVDRQLPEDVAAAFGWTAYQSDDNLNWKPLPLVGPVVFSLFANRFEITTEQTEAPYVKVVARPLPPGITTDPLLTDINVAELQFFLVVPAESARPNDLSIYGTFNGTAKVQLLKKPWLTYDFSAFLSHSNRPAHLGFALINGLTLTQRLSRLFNLNARVDRSDANDGRGPTASNRWSASISAEFLPTLASSLSYGGQLSQRATGVSVNQSLGLFNRADLYEGVSAYSNATYSAGTTELGQQVRNVGVTGTLALRPAPIVTFNGSVAYSDSVASGADQPTTFDTRTLLDASGSFNPFRAISLSGGISRTWSVRTRPTTLANLSGMVSPFQQGNLQLRYSYQQTLDTGSETFTRSHGGGVRWNIRPAWHLDGGFRLFSSTTPTVGVSSFSLFATLVLVLR